MSLESTVVSLVPFEIKEEKPGLIPPRFYIPASDMRTPKLLHVGTASHFVYLDESRGSLSVKNPSDIVAKSIVDDYVTSQLGVDEEVGPALFWVDRKLREVEVLKEFEDQIKEKLHSQKEWFLRIAMIADNDWSRYHQHNVISSFQRKAADIIGWTSREHEWMSPMTTMKATNCPACGLSLPEGTVICGSCKCVIDKEKFKTLQFAS